MRGSMLFAALLLAVAGMLHAEDLVLVDGRYLQVEVLEGDETRGLHVKLLHNGGRIWIPWNLIREEDRERLMVATNVKEEVREVTVEGVRLLTRSGDEWLGVLVEPGPDKLEEGSIPEKVVLHSEGRDVTFNGDVVRAIESAVIPALEAYTKEELYQRELERLDPGENDLQAWWDLAKFATAIGHYGKAIEGFLKVRELDPGYKEDYVTTQLARLEESLKNQRIEEALASARRKAQFHQYTRALSILDELLAMESLDPDLRYQAELRKKDVLKDRYEYYAKRVARGYHRLLERKVREIARDPELSLREARRAVQRDLHKEIVAELGQKYGLDPKEEVEKMWKDRKKYYHVNHTAGYGSGTFIVQGKIKGAERLNKQVERAIRRAMRRNRRDEGGGISVPRQKLPKPPTPDEWWKKATTREKANWLEAYFAENSGHMEVVGERWHDCPTCGATGRVGFTGAQWETIYVTCPRCGGHRRDKGVAYR